jgi:hypothetical protein
MAVIDTLRNFEGEDADSLLTETVRNILSLIQHEEESGSRVYAALVKLAMLPDGFTYEQAEAALAGRDHYMAHGVVPSAEPVITDLRALVAWSLVTLKNGRYCIDLLTRRAIGAQPASQRLRSFQSDPARTTDQSRTLTTNQETALDKGSHGANASDVPWVELLPDTNVPPKQNARLDAKAASVGENTLSPRLRGPRV